MRFHVEITEEITEVRVLEVEADTPSEAHRKAYELWVENGKCQGTPSINVNSRSFTVTDEDDNDHEFEGEPS